MEIKETAFFTVASSGHTVDGRYLSPELINQLAETYHRQKYAGIVNFEHYVSPAYDSKYSVVGDVIELRAIDGQEGNRELQARINAYPLLVEEQDKKKKIYWSIEYYDDFAKTGKPYLVGLAATDTPASLWTQPVKFSRNSASNRSRPIPHTFSIKEDYTVAEHDEPPGWFKNFFSNGGGKPAVEEPKPAPQVGTFDPSQFLLSIGAVLATFSTRLDGIESKFAANENSAPAQTQAASNGQAESAPTALSAAPPASDGDDLKSISKKVDQLMEVLAAASPQGSLPPHGGSDDGFDKNVL